MRVRRVRSARGFGIAVLVAAAVTAPAYAAHEPVLSSRAADPAVARTDDGYVAVATGRRVRQASSPTPAGEWVAEGAALPGDAPGWITNLGAWAPELHRVGETWVLYYSVAARGMPEQQRCIGAATASEPTGPFTYVARPLVCTTNRAGDRVPGRPVSNAGVIDPSVYQAPGGALYLLYKTQKLPASLRIVRLDGTGTTIKEGAISRELVQSNTAIIEHPLLLRRRAQRMVLFASYRTYNTCQYRTIYMKARSIRAGAFQRAPKRNLLTSGDTGLCGPGGADIAPAGNGQRIFFHGWVCQGTTPCPGDFNSNQTPQEGRRVMYARGLRWKGSTPRVGAWVTPSG